MMGKRVFGASLWSSPFFLTVFVSSAVCLAFLGFIFGRFELDVVKGSPQSPESRAIPTYLALFIFAEVYQCILAFDALRNKNTIQIIGLCLFSACMLVYASIQYDQIRKAIAVLQAQKYIELSQWPLMRAFIIAIPCVIALAMVMMSVFAYKLYGEFGWSIYKHVGADIRLKRRYLFYLIFITLLKYDFFFFLGFTIQFVVIVLDKADVEFALTIAVIPLTILFLYLAMLFVKKETRVGMGFIIVVFFAGLAYFLFKMVRMYQPSQAYKYIAARKTLTAFAVITIIVIVATIVNAIICTINFGCGLKQIVDRGNAEPEEEKYPLDNISSFQKSGTRMTID
ncbi:hypothetical protein TRVA0_023S00100 [Trichomonascus vanleenenianus]|uniref:uncharacterized protein n=1 Tax=Trichomonascus vanleenenianus TaxID=2268995 RepID=UPI003ECA8D86